MKTVTLALAGLALAAVSASAQTPLPRGPEFLVNQHTTGNQVATGIAMQPDGNFIVAWASGQDGSGSGIYARRYAADGTPRGAEFRVNTYTSGNQIWAAVDVAPGGEFDVVWASYGGQDGSSSSVHGQRFDAAGVPRGAEFQLNTYTTGPQTEPKIARAPDGSFVVAFTTTDSNAFGVSFGVAARRFDASGSPLGAEFLVNAFTTGHQFDITLDGGAGGFVVAWRDEYPRDGSGWGIGAQRLDAAGVRVGANFTVNSFVSGDQFLPSVSVRPGGEFVVSFGSRSGDGSGEAVMARRFDAAGTPIGPDFLVNSYTTGTQSGGGGGRSVAHDADGGFVVTWLTRPNFPTDLGDIRGQRFNAAGGAAGDEFAVNEHITGVQRLPLVAMDDAGSFVVAWLDGSAHDGDMEGVYARRYISATHAPEALVVDPAPTATSNGNRVHEPGEEVEIRPRWLNPGLVPQAMAATLSNAAGPAGATYTITDGAGDYGVIGPAAAMTCIDCYAFHVTDTQPRPAVHWDATVFESASPPAVAEKRWVLHLGRSFGDVGVANPFYRFVETLFHRGVTTGCGAATYCPTASTTREQMAVFVLTAKEGAGYAPPPCGMTPTFADVPVWSIFCPWIEELARRGVVGGCGGGNYCPTAAVSREQMSVFVLRTLDPALAPPACSPPNLFADVPETSPFCRWIEELARRAIVTGCGGGNYCPSAAVTREQMGVFIAATFGLTLYGP